MPTNSGSWRPPRVEGRPVDFTTLLLPAPPLLDLVLTTEILRYCNSVSGRALFRHRTVSATPEPVVASSGVPLPVDGLLRDVDRTDVVLVIGGNPPVEETGRSCGLGLARIAQHGALLAAVDWGVVILAEAGLLRGRDVAAHWEVIPRLNESDPDFRISEQVYAYDNGRLTGAGRLSLIEMVLFIAGFFYGDDLPANVAEDIIYPAPRPATAPQRRLHGALLTGSDARLQACVEHMERNLSSPLTVKELSGIAGVSPRHLQKLAGTHLRCSIMEYFTRLRLRTARDLLLHTDLAILEIAVSVGFGSTSAFSRAFRREFASSARDFRRHYRTMQRRPFGTTSYGRGGSGW